MSFLFFALVGSSLHASEVCRATEDYFSEVAQGSMQFFRGASGGNNSRSAWIFATGEITEDTPRDFENFIQAQSFVPELIFLDSPGGNLRAGLELGKAIRQLDLSTMVGAPHLYPDLELKCFQDGAYKSFLYLDMKDGVCASACAYAFLGGKARTLHDEHFSSIENSMLGFHQFWTESGAGRSLSRAEAKALEESTLSAVQYVLGAIVQYLVEMGVDAELISVGSVIGPQDMAFPDQETLAELRVLTGQTGGRWSMEPEKSGLIASVSNSDPASSVKQIIAYCDATSRTARFRMQVKVRSTAHDGLSAEAVSPHLDPNFGVDFTLDNQRVFVPKDAITISDAGEYVFVDFYLSDDLIGALETSKFYEINLSNANAFGWHSINGQLQELERKMIGLAFQNCI